MLSEYTISSKSVLLYILAKFLVIKSPYSMVASPTSTFVHGEVQNILELGLDYLSGERFRASVVDMIF